MTRWTLPAVLLSAWLLGGCTLIPEREAVDRSWFLLELPAEPAPLQAKADEPLAVELGSVRVAPAYSGKGLVYRLGDHRYESDYYNEWFLTPAEQIEQLLRERWTREGAAIELVDNADAVWAEGRPAVQLHLLVTALYGDLDGANPDTRAQADADVPVRGLGRVGLRTQLRTAERSRLAHMEAQHTIDRRSAARLVAALSQATADVLAELEHELLRTAQEETRE
ncbi:MULTISPECIES: membrane integrity-associated transporter subunit PqiC [unclassified Thioalkalivibrio]|uniref:PqiC family protein n=1 Tax=unclassified Thioalkalivibrio TaxID=2621013 RepID=UPI000378D480|nr:MULTISPECIES: ABC-type transport auxiliary lipoprotein family protein [unclassified Thioalkalivibrio]